MKLSNLALQCIEDIDFRTIETGSNKNARSATKSRSRSTRKREKVKVKVKEKEVEVRVEAEVSEKVEEKLKLKEEITGGYKSENVKTKEISNINDAFSQIIYNIKLQNETLPENEKLYNCYYIFKYLHKCFSCIDIDHYSEPISYLSSSLFLIPLQSYLMNNYDIFETFPSNEDIEKLMDEVSVIIGMDDIPTIETPDQIDIISRSINSMNINKPKDISPTGVADIDKITGGGLSDTERNLLNDLKNYFDPRYDQSFISQNDLDNLNFDSLSIEKLNQTHQIAIESNFINKTINVDENGVFVEENPEFGNLYYLPFYLPKEKLNNT